MKDAAAASPPPSSPSHFSHDRSRLYDYLPFNDMSTDKYHRELHNRLINSLSDIYLLPDDEEEHARLQAESKALDLAFESLYALVDAHLKKQPSSTCLDVGIDSMASRNPTTQFTGLDLVPPLKSKGAKKAMFEVHDVNGGLERYQNSFDVVHVRNLAQGIQRFSSCIGDIAETLRPGGMGVFIEWDYQVYNASRVAYTFSSATFDPSRRVVPGFQAPSFNRQSSSSLSSINASSSSSFSSSGSLYPSSSASSSASSSPSSPFPPATGASPFGARPTSTEQIPALVHFLRAVVRASTAAGSHISSVGHLGAFVQRSYQFKDVQVRDVWVPVNPQPGCDAQERKLATEFRPAFVGFLSSCSPLLLSHGGYNATELSSLEDAARIEIMGGKVPLYVRFICVTGVKI
ncbi:hypothetical protein FRC17_002793 [Serendipita sp. 399]|nr:hypothetical protein FRC17_002793 [Serendipita sp. 399]